MKGLILAAGRGTRLFPLTKDMPKPLIKVNGKPTIMYCIERLVAAGITDIGIVINERHQELFSGLINIEGLNISYIYQNVPRGISDAIRLSSDYVGDDRFIVVLGDNIILDPLSKFKKQLEQPNVDCVLALQIVDNPEDYGVIDTIEGTINIEEKPVDPKTNIAVMGIYGFTPDIFAATEIQTPSIKGEYEVTDLIMLMVRSGARVNFEFVRSVDMGTIHRLEQADTIVKAQLNKE